MRPWTRTLLILLLVLAGGAGIVAAQSDTPEPSGVTLEDLLNPDGTLQLDGAFNGTLDVSGWQVTLDPEEGPIFQPEAGPPAQWTNLGSSTDSALNNTVLAIAVSGTDVYVGGSFANAGGIAEADYVARWNGTAWNALGSNGFGNGALGFGSVVNALAASGNDVYVGGFFFDAAGIATADYVARWDGATWSALGSLGGNGALNGPVNALAVSGNNVYVGGNFTDAAGIATADFVARWDGTNWNALGNLGGGGALNNQVRALAVSGGNLYVGGDFTNAAGLPAADYVARWNGSAWSALGSFGGDGALSNIVNALAVNGNDVYVGGSFTDAAGLAAADYVARWNGSAWSALGSVGVLNGPVYALAVSGTDVYVGGAFTDAGGVAAIDYVARWSGGTWTAVGILDGGGAMNAPVFALAAGGTDVYAGGVFINAGGSPAADYLARWNGIAWNALGSSSSISTLNGPVFALAVSGTDVYVGGAFTDAGGVPAADYVARWNGSAWSALGSNGAGNGALGFGSAVNALAVSGNNVYVGGFFVDAAGIATADYVARWDGSVWNALGSNGFGNGALNNTVNALAVRGNEVFVGGAFTDAAGVAAADFVAHWDGATWSALGSLGGGGVLNNQVRALAVSGNEVYVGGNFTDAAGIATADYVARWDGTNWYALGRIGANGALNNPVNALAVRGNEVYAGGAFTNAGDVAAADYVAFWDGTGWNALGGSGGDGALGLGSVVNALAVSGNDVYVGGNFNNAAGIATADYVARWDRGAWSGLGGVGGAGALTSQVRAMAISGNDVFIGGFFFDAASNPLADYVAAYVTPPTVLSIARLDRNPTGAASVRFQVTFSEPVAGVAANDFTPTSTGGVSGASVSGVSGGGATYIVTVTTGTGDGTLRLDVPAGTTISDLVGLNLYNVPFTTGESYLIDRAAPTVTSITRLDPNPTSALSVRFQVAFSEPVAGVAADDFALAVTGFLSGASVSNVSGSGATYVVTVGTGTGNGTLRLIVPAGATITDLAGSSLSNLPFTTGEFYNINRFPPLEYIIFLPLIKS
ncbi:MAG: hypothetical protein RMK84_20105 [Oscillochloridaceae bacterium]|nr:hypothetical protein [Chloroflexaceae bacterium]MDW8392426.1 hypothetical protein [Oscillochloridaceae bacterium]